MKETTFSAVLRPHRSLSQCGFFIVMALISTISFVAGMFFFLIGAWPVVGFFGLDVLLIYGAFKWNYHAAKQHEIVEIIDKELVITRISAWGKAQNWQFSRFWLRIDHAVDKTEPYDNPPLMITSHGHSLEIAKFLPPTEKTEFAVALRQALQAS